MDGKTYVILGGNGPFGVHTALYLLAHADPKKVICVGRNPQKPAAFSLRVGEGDPRYAYQQIHLVYEQDRLLELCDAEKPEVIVNFAALAHASSWRRAWRFYETNLMALVRITEALVGRPYLKRWIQIGSSELYGSVDAPAKEDAPLLPSSPYAVSKAAGDMHLLSMIKVLKFPMNILRPSNAYGPGQQLYRVIPRAVLCGLTGQRLPLHGGGQARKSYIHARDLGRAIHLVSERAPLGTVYNVGPAEPVAIRDLVELVAEAMDMPFDQLCEVSEDRVGEDAQYWIDSSAIRHDVGWEPTISHREGIQEMIEWGKTYLEDLRAAPTEYVLHA